MSTDRDSGIMQRALELARLAEGRTSPNPMVGAVIVRDGHIVGEGYHRKAGQKHAEIEALEDAGESARGATIYVTLEPCCRRGRTPPCTDALIEAGIAEVVYSVRDPNPKINGRGQAQLEAAGVRVRNGVCGRRGEELIQPFYKLCTQGLPLVTVKFAMTLDGKIATRTGHSRWISGGESRRYTHDLRNLTDVIVVGAGTVIVDNPRLTTRIEDDDLRHPLRIVVDSRGRAPLDAQVFSARLPGRSVLATTNKASAAHCAKLESKGVDIWRLATDSNGRVDILALLRRVATEEMLTVLVEGGSGLLGSFFERDLVDRVLVAIAPKVIGGVDAPSPVGGLGVSQMDEALKFFVVETVTHGDDLWIQAEKPQRSATDESGQRAGEQSLVRAQAAAQLPTKWGVFEAIAFEDMLAQEHLALRIATNPRAAPLVRLHSECLTGDAFGSTRCDCGDQLAESQRRIVADGHGAVIYLRQEGRGIGLVNKLRAYALQDEGLDTVEANHQLGLPADLRDYGTAAQILLGLGMQQVRLLTNNPEKVRGLEQHGIDVLERVPLVIPPTANSARYLAAKRDRLGHLLPTYDRVDLVPALHSTRKGRG